MHGYTYIHIHMHTYCQDHLLCGGPSKYGHDSYTTKVKPTMMFSPDKGLVVKVPHGDISVAAAGEADLGVRADGQSVAGRG